MKQKQVLLLQKHKHTQKETQHTKHKLFLKLYKNNLLIGLSNCRLVGTNKAPAFKQSVLDFQLVAWITY